MRRAAGPGPLAGVADAALVDVADAVLVDVVTGSGERWRVSSTQVAASAAAPRPPNSAEELTSTALTRHTAAAPVVVVDIPEQRWQHGISHLSGHQSSRGS